jgi:hypothetical protein
VRTERRADEPIGALDRRRFARKIRARRAYEDDRAHG